MDRERLRNLLVDMRVAQDDAAAVVEDMLRPPRERELGHLLHEQHYAEAREKFLLAHELAMALIEATQAH